jgi:hypothetical protein
MGVILVISLFGNWKFLILTLVYYLITLIPNYPYYTVYLDISVIIHNTRFELLSIKTPDLSKSNKTAHPYN